MTIRNEEIIRDKLHFFADRGLAIHLTLNNKFFRNGNVVSFHSDSIIFFDEKLEEIPIFFSEILDVQKREKKR